MNNYIQHHKKNENYEMIQLLSRTYSELITPSLLNLYQQRGRSNP